MNEGNGDDGIGKSKNGFEVKTQMYESEVEKSESMRVEIRSRKARKLIEETLRIADSPKSKTYALIDQVYHQYTCSPEMGMFPSGRMKMFAADWGHGMLCKAQVRICTYKHVPEDLAEQNLFEKCKFSSIHYSPKFYFVKSSQQGLKKNLQKLDATQ
ncbi:hypothetical protein RJ641_023054 [Dillenia turbinata]|uniref:Uncharacterized protein n=1 Tax=Dillenia turbinata TaxID=194707 RepID=A0AAN8UMU5_9MAGN